MNEKKVKYLRQWLRKYAAYSQFPIDVLYKRMKKQVKYHRRFGHGG